MSEQAAVVEAPKEETKSAASAQVSPEVIDQIRKNILAEVIPEVQKQTESIAGKKFTEAQNAQNQRVLQAMGMGAPENHSEAVLNRFLEDPMEVLTMVGHKAKETAKEELRAEREAEKKAEQVFSRAVKDVMSDRLDIRSNEEAMELVQNYYEAGPSSLNEKERLEQAVKKYDNLMEKNGAGKSDTRIQAAKTSASSRSSGRSSEAPNQQSLKETETAIAATERDEKIARYKKTHGGLAPESMRR
jgi:hypothetical protein